MTVQIDLSPEACERRLHAALTEITDHPEHWDQGVWSLIENAAVEDVIASMERREFPCGTCSCLAGVGVIQAGFARPGVHDAALGATPGLLLTGEGVELLLTHPSSQRNWSDHANDFGGLASLLFGLTIDQSTRLFNSDNSLLALWQAAEEFTYGRVALVLEQEQKVLAIDEERAGEHAREMEALLR